jgi:hypothetical protein
MNSLILVTPTQLAIVLLVTSVTAFPCSMIFKRLGFSAWWSLLCFVPVGAIAFLWYLAFARWPEIESANAPRA